jgi:hypothetical protein
LAVQGPPKGHPKLTTVWASELGWIDEMVCQAQARLAHEKSLVLLLLIHHLLVQLPALLCRHQMLLSPIDNRMRARRGAAPPGVLALMSLSATAALIATTWLAAGAGTVRAYPLIEASCDL